MKLKALTLFLTLSLGLVASTGFAAVSFGRLDRNNDGAISRYEWQSGGLSRAAFSRYDWNEDGFVTRSELFNQRTDRDVYYPDNQVYNPTYYGNDYYPYQPTYNYNPYNTTFGYNPYGYGYNGYNPYGGYGAPVSRNALLAQTGVNLLGGLITSLVAR